MRFAVVEVRVKYGNFFWLHKCEVEWRKWDGNWLTVLIQKSIKLSLAYR
jgi:hypothetical protein